MRRLDQRLQAPPDTDLLRGDPDVRSAGLVVGRGTGPGQRAAPLGPGEVVVTEGEPAHEFFVILAGEVEVTHDGDVLRREGPGEVFGEIGLLRNVPRTATVTAVTDVELLVLGRKPFLETVSGTLESLAPPRTWRGDGWLCEPPLGALPSPWFVSTVCAWG